MLVLVLLIFAFVLLVLAALNVPSHPRLSLGWAGLACFMAAQIVPKISG